MGIINKPYTFSPNTTASSSEVNSDFDTIYNEFNGSIGAANLATDAVTTAKIADSNVTTAKIADLNVTTAKLADAGVTNAKLATTTGEPGGAWESWTPSYTNFTAGNGTLTYAKYKKVGNTVSFKYKFVWGSTTSASGTITISLPVTAHADEVPATGLNFVGVGNALDSGTQQYQIFPNIASTTTMTAHAAGAAGTYTNPAAVNATVPMTWTTSDVMIIRGSYESAA